MALLQAVSGSSEFLMSPVPLWAAKHIPVPILSVGPGGDLGAWSCPTTRRLFGKGFGSTWRLGRRPECWGPALPDLGCGTTCLTADLILINGVIV